MRALRCLTAFMAALFVAVLVGRARRRPATVTALLADRRVRDAHR